MTTNPQSSASLATYLSICTGDFAGREWVFAAIDHWLAEENCCIFLILVKLGIGGDFLVCLLDRV